MDDKLMYIINVDTQNYPFCRLQLVTSGLDTQLKKPTINFIKFPKANKQENIIITLVTALCPLPNCIECIFYNFNIIINTQIIWLYLHQNKEILRNLIET